MGGANFPREFVRREKGDIETVNEVGNSFLFLRRLRLLMLSEHCIE